MGLFDTFNTGPTFSEIYEEDETNYKGITITKTDAEIYLNKLLKVEKEVNLYKKENIKIHFYSDHACTIPSLPDNISLDEKIGIFRRYLKLFKHFELIRPKGFWTNTCNPQKHAEIVEKNIEGMKESLISILYDNIAEDNQIAQYLFNNNSHYGVSHNFADPMYEQYGLDQLLLNKIAGLVLYNDLLTVI